MKYTIFKFMLLNQEVTCLRQNETMSFIPFDPANTDYQEYLKWIQEGGKVIDNPPSDTSNE